MKILLKCISASLLTLIALWVVSYGLLHTEKGQRWVLHSFINYLEEKTETHWTIAQVDFSFPFQIRLDQVAVHDSQNASQACVNIHQLTIDCFLSSLLKGHWINLNIQAEGIHLHHLPSRWSSFSSIKSPQEQIDTPSFIFPLNIHRLTLDDVTVDGTVVDHFISYPLLADWFKKSSFHLDGGFHQSFFDSHQILHLSLTTSTPSDLYPDLSIKIDTKQEFLTLSLGAQNVPSTWLISQNSVFKLDCALKASASFHAWQTFLQEGEGLASPIGGSFEAILKSSEPDFLALTWIGHESFIAGRYLICSKQEIDLFDLILHSPCAHLNGKTILTAAQELKQGSFSGDLCQLSWISFLTGLPIEGKGTIQGEFEGPLSNPSVSIQAKLPVLNINGHMMKNFNGAMVSNGIANQFQGTIALKMNYEEIPYELTTSYQWHFPYTFSLSDIQLDGLGSRVEGQACFFFPDFLCEGQLYAYAKDLKQTLAFFQLPLEGEGSLRIAFKPDLLSKKQQIYGDWVGHHLQWKDLGADSLSGHFKLIDPSYPMVESPQIWIRADGYQVQWSYWQADRLALETTLKYPVQISEIDLKINLQHFQDYYVNWDAVTLTTHIDPTSEQPWPFILEAQTTAKEKWNFNASGTWHLNDDGWLSNVNEYAGQLGNYPTHLLKPATFLKQGLKLTASSLAFKWGEANIEGDMVLDAKDFSCQIQGHNMPSDLLALFYPSVPLTGKLSFKADLAGGYEHPEGQVHVNLHQIQVNESLFANKPFIEGDIHLQLIPTGMYLKGALNGIGHQPVLAEGTLPLIFSASPIAINIDDSQSFDLHVQAEGELDPYLHLFYNDTSNLSGQTKIALDIRGQIRAPIVQGQVELFEGIYESFTTGTIYKNISARLRGDGSKVILESFSAQDGKQGIIKATGEIELETKDHFPFNFQIDTQQIAIVDSDYMTVTGSGKLNLTGNQSHAKLQGQLTSDQAVVSLEEALPSQVKSVEFKYINVAEGEEVPSKLLTSESHWPLDLEIKLDLPKDVLIKGRQVTSEWKGHLLITGTSDQPLIHGDLHLVHGDYNFNGKIFNLAQGHLHFAGIPQKKTSLYVIASKEIDRIRTEIIVKGPLNKLVMSFRSDPPLSEREVLSYILFNRGISDITPDQGAVLKQSFMALNASTSSEQGSDFLSRLRNNVKIIDRLDLSGEGEDDLSLQIGKYVTDDVCISINKSISAAANRVAIEANLPKNFKAQAEVGDDEQGKVMLKWKKDY